MNDEKEKDIKKVIEDIKQCIFEGRDKEECIEEFHKKEGLSEDELELIKWELENEE